MFTDQKSSQVVHCQLIFGRHHLYFPLGIYYCHPSGNLAAWPRHFIHHLKQTIDQHVFSNFEVDYKVIPPDSKYFPKTFHIKHIQCLLAGFQYTTKQEDIRIIKPDFGFQRELALPDIGQHCENYLQFISLSVLL